MCLQKLLNSLFPTNGVISWFPNFRYKKLKRPGSAKKREVLLMPGSGKFISGGLYSLRVLLPFFKVHIFPSTNMPKHFVLGLCVRSHQNDNIFLWQVHLITQHWKLATAKHRLQMESRLLCLKLTPSIWYFARCAFLKDLLNWESSLFSETSDVHVFRLYVVCCIVG